MTNPHRETNLYFKHILIGNSTQALVSSFLYGIPLFGNASHKPIPYSFVEPDVDLSDILVENKKNVFTNLGGSKVSFGIQKLELWNIMVHRLSVMGLCPMFGEYAFNFWDHMSEILHEKRFSLVVKGRVVHISFENMILFDYPVYQNGELTFLVNDYFKLSRVSDLKADYFQCAPTSVVDEICYENFIFKEGNTHYCCTKSIVSGPNLNTWEFSQTSIRLKMEVPFYWDVDKKIKLEVYNREKTPILNILYDDFEELITMRALDSELS